MPPNRLVGSHVAEFWPDNDHGEPIALHKYLQTSQDQLKPRIAVHEFLKVDGGEVELMGNAPNTYRFLINYVGGDWRDRYFNLVARLQRSPKGLLVHPVFSGIKVAWSGIEGASIDVATGTNAVSIPITFVEDAIDTNRTAGQDNDFAAFLDELFAAIASIAVTSSPFSSAATAVALLTTTSAELGRALIAANTGATDAPGIDRQLADVGSACNEAIAALEADPANVAAADAQPSVTDCERIYAASIDAVAAYRASKPPLVDYTVAVDTDVLTLASLLYGPDASARVEEILSLNRIANPYRITAGTVLTLSSPTLV